MRYGLVLVRVSATQPQKTLKLISGIGGVLNAYIVFGRFDIVVFIEAGDYYKLKDIAAEIAAVEGVKSTETLVHGD
jgi:uncharacterized protein with GYD domain